MQLSYGGQVTVPVPYTAAPSLLQRVLRVSLTSFIVML